jgi:hypothetical protein
MSGALARLWRAEPGALEVERVDLNALAWMFAARRFDPTR